ncbi:cupredoxin domain-containing protein [Candidatus Berkelbacteria bacterium]|nr:cupredoxin domain-containing protein [Candidatus Berkelbacteria bacterium]
MRKQILVPLLVAVALVGAGCGAKPEKATQTSPAVVASGSLETPLTGTVKLVIEDFAYTPPTLIVKKGTVVEATNRDVTGHTVTADDGSFDTKTISKDKTVSLTMDTVGTFAVHCTPHPQITGTITVVD